MTLPWSNCCAVKWDPRFETALQTVELGPSVPSPCCPWGLRSHLGAVTATASTTFPVPRPGSPTVKCKFSPNNCSTVHRSLVRDPAGPHALCLYPPQAAGECVKNANRCTWHTHTPSNTSGSSHCSQDKTKQTKNSALLTRPHVWTSSRHNTPWSLNPPPHFA